MDESPAKRLPNPDEGNGKSPAAPKPVELIIRFHPATQDVEVIAPADQRVLCYGMLEMARATIDEVYLKAELAESQSRIVPASGPLPPFPHRR